MPSDAGEPAPRDMEHHIISTSPNQFVATLDYEAFRGNTRTLYAVTLCLEIISGASRRLPDDMKQRHPLNRMERHGQEMFTASKQGDNLRCCTEGSYC